MKTPPSANESTAIEDIEMELLLEGIFRVYGYDFREYAAASLKRRVKHRIQAEGAGTVSSLQNLVLHDEQAMERLLNDLSIPVTEMFRDPPFFQALRNEIIPWLRTLPSIRIWHAGCATGEEAYSMAILLAEEGLASKATIYATDLNEHWLAQAKSGTFDLGRMQTYTHNYMRAGGCRPFSDYYTVVNGAACFDPALRQQIVFGQHNLATDHTFNEFHLILCRNVFIYFRSSLQRRVLQLFRDSLAAGGILALGSKEAIVNHGEWAELSDPVHRMYRHIV